MFRSIQTQKKIFVLLQIALSIAAVYHLAGVFYRIDSSSVLRHALFAGLDLFCVYGFLKGRMYFVFFFSAFTIQQYYAHGQQLVDLWINRGEIHWVSVFVLVLLPLGLTALIAHTWQSAVDGIFTNANVE